MLRAKRTEHRQPLATAHLSEQGLNDEAAAVAALDGASTAGLAACKGNRSAGVGGRQAKERRHEQSSSTSGIGGSLQASGRGLSAVKDGKSAPVEH